MSDHKFDIAFLGAGLMGGGMASQLLTAGHRVAVYNRSRAKAEELQAKGARVADSPADAAKNAGVVIAMLADDAASREVWTGKNGAAGTAPAGSVWIDSGTITPGWARELGQIAAQHQCRFLDAPVTGSRVQARDGQLLFLVGGDAADLDRVKPLFDAMGRGVLPMGGVGAGATAKLINNFLCGVQVASFAEAVAWIERSGLDQSTMAKLLTEGAPGSPLVRVMAERMMNRDYETNFAARLMAKDLRYAQEEGRQAGVDLSTAAASISRFTAATEAGLGDKDMSGVVEILRPK